VALASIGLATFLPFQSTASETISLARFLALANEQGHNIIFSDALVLPRHRIQYEPSTTITREQIERALVQFNLQLSSTDPAIVTSNGTDEPAEVQQKPEWLELPIEEIVVSSSLHEFKLQHVTSALYLDQQSLNHRAVTANDALRVAAKLPGVASNGVATSAAIRGGLKDETLIRLDEFQLYEPYHLHHFQDLISPFDYRTIEGISFATGGFPAEYGDRMSGVMDIQGLRPSEHEPTREIGIGLYTASYFQVGSWGKHDFMLSARRSTIDLIGDSLKTDLGTPSFADLNFKSETQLSDRTRLSTNLLWFGDDISINDSGMTEVADSSYGNTYVWLTLDRDLETTSSKTQLGITAIKDDREGWVNKPGMVNGYLNDDQEFRMYQFSHKQTWRLGDSFLELGGTYRYLDAEYSVNQMLSIDSRFAAVSNFPRPAERSLSRDEYGNQVNLFANFKRALLQDLFVELGVRLDAQDYISRDWEYEPNPRISILYRLFGGDLRASWGEYSQTQGIHELQLSDGIETFHESQEAHHQVTSYTRPFGNFDVRLEAYRKEVDHTASYFENLSDPVSLVPELQVDRFLVDPRQVKARGFEISISTTLAGNELWFNYTRASVKEEVAGQEVYRSSDQKHAANLGWSATLRNWQVSLETGYHSGWPTSAITLDDNGMALPVQRNDRRLPNFVTVDAKATRTWLFNDNQLRLELGITNLANRENRIGTEYSVVGDEFIEEPSDALPLAPFIDVYWRF
jgi:outer membrane cobalamin receptor